MVKKADNMNRIFEGIVVSDKTLKTVVVDVVFRNAHKVYKKLIKTNKRMMVDSGNFSLKIGNRVKIIETIPMSKNKHFKVMEVIKNGSA